jgi:phosphatidylinositol alpha-1,6-mannosyltransferase
MDRRQRLALLNLRALVESARFKPDVVLNAHIIMSPGAWAVSRLLRVPYVQYLHGAEVANRPRLARFAVRNAASVIAVSAYTASLVEHWIAPHKVHRIPPGVDLPTISIRSRADEQNIITVARLTEWYKGHDVMLRALPLVRARVPGVRWLVLGDGHLRPFYERVVLSLGLTEEVRFLGDTDDVERDRWLDQSCVFAMPSRLSANGGGEGFGIVYLEAGAHGLPVVAGNVAGARDAVLDGETGVLVDPTDHLAVAEALTGLLLDRRRAQSLGTAGQARARSYAWPRVAQRVEDLLHRVAVRAA